MSTLRENRFVFLLIFFTLIAFCRKLSIPFMWDDFPFILDNDEIHEISHIGRWFYEDIALLYRPLREIVTTLCYFVFGENPLGYHVVGLLLHIGVVLTLFGCLNRIFENRSLNFFAALIFALHPVHAERVFLITGSFDILGDFLTLLAFYFYLLSRSVEATAQRTYSLFLFFLALLSSENAAILLPLIIVYELIFGTSPFWRKDMVMTFLSYFAVFGGYFLVRSLTIQTIARTSDTDNYFSVLFSMPQVFLQYLHITFFPVNLAAYRAPQLPDQDFFLTNLLSCGIVALLLLFSFWKRPPRELRFAILWFFACLIPVSNIIPTGNILEERYLYLPSFAFSIFFLFIGSLLIERKKFAFGLLGVLSLLFGVLLVHKSSFYQSERTKWLKDVQTLQYLYPADYEATLNHEAKTLDLQNPLNEAAKIRSLSQGSVFLNAANSVRGENGCKAAEEFYRYSLALNPMNVSAWHNLYGCYFQQGRRKEFVSVLEKMVDSKKIDNEVKVDLLMALVSQLINDDNPKWKKYIPYFSSLSLTEQRKFELLRNLGVGGYRERHFHAALYFLRKALEVKENVEVREKVVELEKALGMKK